MIGFPSRNPLEETNMKRNYPVQQQQVIPKQVNPLVTGGGQTQIQPQPRTGMAGLFDKLNQRSSTTGLSGLENFAQALDAVILPELRAGEAIRQRGAQRVAGGNKNKTVEYLKSINRNDLAEAVQSGALTPTDATKLMLQERGQDKDFERKKQLELYKAGLTGNINVQSVTDLPDLSGVMIKYKDGRVEVRTADNRTLSGQEAVDFVDLAISKNVENQRAIAGAKEGGKLEETLKYAGDIEFQKKTAILKTDMIKLAGESRSKIRQNLANYQIALDALDDGAKTGRIMNLIPDVTAAAQSIKTAKSKLGLDIIGSVTFGALSEAELKLAMDTALPDANLSPDELRKWINDRVNAQRKALAAVNDTLEHFLANRSLRSYYTDVVGINSTGSVDKADDNDPLGIN
jgi:hypothetical protein